MAKPITLHACTVIARNYLALARVVSTSFLEHHPDGRFSVLILDDVDGEVDESQEPFDVLRPTDIMPEGEFLDMAAAYNVLELATAVKPWLLRAVLASGASTVAYLDPDLCFYRPIDDLFERAGEAGIVLTPHTVSPVPRDDRTPTEQYLLRAGVFNLGFIVVAENAAAFLDWWAERLRYDCIVDPANGLFVDQRWIDLVPGYFSHAIVTDPSLNVAYWNLGNRSVEERDGDALVDGRPLRFFHFSGFDPSRPEHLSKHAGDRPRYDLESLPAVQRLCREYGERLLDAGHDRLRSIEYGLDVLPDGSRLDDRMRRLYRQHRSGGPDSPPNPWVEPQAFMTWLRQPAVGATVSRYLHALYEDRGDVQAAYPDLTRDADGFFEWVRVSGVTEERVPPEMVPPPGSARGAAAPAPTRDAGSPAAGLGVVVAGYFRAEMGVGEAGRRIITALESSDVPYATFTYDRTVVRQQHPFEDRGEKERFPIALVCVNADQTTNFARDVGPDFFRDRYTIGQWFWEVDVFPARWNDAFGVVDEIWAGSEYVAQTLRQRSPVPVVAMPLPIDVPETVPEIDEREFGLEDRFTFLFAFDFLSVFERKNPLAVIDAFNRAFPDQGESQLVLKTTNASRFPKEAERLRRAVEQRSDIVWMDEYLTRERQQALLYACDCYVSLHRSEGFGLTMAEAMAAGKPVVATGYSGNLDFMTDETSILVPYTLHEVGHGYDPYPPDASWADPDIEAAATQLRRLHDDRALARDLGERARRHVTQNHTAEVRGRQARERLESVLSSPSSMRRYQTYAESPPETVLDAPVAGDLAHRIQALSLRGYSHSPALGRLTDWTRSGTERLLYPFIRDLRGILSEIHSLKSADYREQTRAHEAAAATDREVQTLRQVVDELTVQVARLSSVETGVQERAAATDSEVEALRHAVDALTARAELMPPDVEGAVAQFQQSTDERLASLVERYGALSEGVSANDEFKRGASQHLQGLTTAVSALSASFDRLQRHVNATPYRAPGSGIDLVPDPIHGVEALGFRGGLGDGDYEDFEDVFRGPRALVLERARFYVPFLLDRSPVLDVGCGRGELLEVLEDAGVEAHGVDSDEGMVASSSGRGLSVTRADAIEHLLGQRDKYGAIVAIHFIEHLATDDIMPFMRAAYASLRSDGLLVMETVNPNAIAGLKTFWVDLTHVHPIFPEVALQLARMAGFARADVVLPDFSGGEGRQAYEDRLVAQGEYALIARKCS